MLLTKFGRTHEILCVLMYVQLRLTCPVFLGRSFYGCLGVGYSESELSVLRALWSVGWRSRLLDSRILPPPINPR